MAFNLDEVSALLVQCHRRCCICHRFCGVKIETDHMLPREEGGADSIDNAIPVCFECHAEIHSYNNNHPRGRKFRSNELRQHKEQWLEICRNQPNMLLASTKEAGVGPLQALVDELDFNRVVAQQDKDDAVGCLFLNDQFKLAIDQGAISLLEPTLKQSIMEAYRVINRANGAIAHTFIHPINVGNAGVYRLAASQSVMASREAIEQAYNDLLSFLSSDK